MNNSVNVTDSQIHYANWVNLGLFIIPIATICGNVLIALSVHVEKRLQNRFNYFLVSLAVSDLLSATLVMPVSAIKMIKADIANNWPVELCLAWYSLDVFFTATTIIHLCTISLDRYFALNNPLKYRRDKHLPSTLYFKIIASWIIPFCIACPLFILALYLDRTENKASYKGCGPHNALFIFTAVIVTFLIPLVIMIITYILTVHTIIVQTRRFDQMMITNPFKSPTHSKFDFLNYSKNKKNACVQNGSYDTSLEGSNSSYHCSEKYELRPIININSKKALPPKENISFPQSTVSLVKVNSEDTDLLYKRSLSKLQNNFRIYNEEDGFAERSQGLYRPRSSVDITSEDNNLVFSNILTDQRFSDQNLTTKLHFFVSNRKYLNVENFTYDLSNINLNDETKSLSWQKSIKISIENLKVTDKNNINHDHQHSFETLTMIGGPIPVTESQDSLSLNFSPPISSTKSFDSTKFGRNFLRKNKNNYSKNIQQKSSPLISISNHRNHKLQKHTKRNIRKTRKAVQVLGTLFGLFLLCYLPFFLVYMADFLCKSCNESLANIIPHLEWVGYSASMLNPVVYHIFNPIFKMTFRRLLHGNCHKSRSKPHNLSSFI